MQLLLLLLSLPLLLSLLYLVIVAIGCCHCCHWTIYKFCFQLFELFKRIHTTSSCHRLGADSKRKKEEEQMKENWPCWQHSGVSGVSLSGSKASWGPTLNPLALWGCYRPGVCVTDGLLGQTLNPLALWGCYRPGVCVTDGLLGQTLNPLALWGCYRPGVCDRRITRADQACCHSEADVKWSVGLLQTWHVWQEESHVWCQVVCRAVTSHLPSFPSFWLINLLVFRV